MTRKLLLFLFLILGVSVSVCAQGPGPDHGKKDRDKMMKEVREFKIKYIAQEIELQDNQKEQFVALYNEMSDKRDGVMREAFKLERKVKRDSNATEADYKAAADAMNKARAEDAAIEKEYDEKFAKFLTSKQIYKMKSAEEEFRRKMEEMRHNKKKRDKR